jgi:hypothetical protein
MSGTTTPRLALPCIGVGQAQTEPLIGRGRLDQGPTESDFRFLDPDADLGP